MAPKGSEVSKGNIRAQPPSRTLKSPVKNRSYVDLLVRFRPVRGLMDHVQTPSGSSSGPPRATAMGAVGTNEATGRPSGHSAASPMARIGGFPVPVASADTERFEDPAVSIRLAFADDDTQAAFWRHLAGHSVQITEPDDGPCADYVLTGAWRWNDLLGAGEIGVRAWSVVTDEAIGEASTVALTGEERVFVYGPAGGRLQLSARTESEDP